MSSSGTYSQYSGMKGYVYVFEGFLSGFADTVADTNGYNIAAQAFDTEGTSMYNTLAMYHSSYSTSTVKFNKFQILTINR